MKRSILICDDEKNIRSGLAMAMELEGYESIEATDGQDAWDKINKMGVDLVITDLRMPRMSGEDLLRKIIGAYPRMPVIILTGHGTIETAVEAMRGGAVDFFTKPVDLDRLSLVVRKALSDTDLYAEHERLKEEVQQLKARNRYDRIIGKSQKMVELMDTVSQVAPTKASVLITGESGVGKELVADAIHELSNRSKGPFIKVHCAALTASLLESELFGHEKGSFTGAVKEKKGRFELADGGTIFLDEIGEIDAQTQVKLLRVLQERQFERVGGEKSITVDVRIVCATNRDLPKEIEKGNFREDLYYRLNVVHLDVPPLRERKDDIPLLMTSFLQQFNSENGRSIEAFSNQAKRALLGYEWPGNIRELRNCIESAVVLARTSIIEVEDLPVHIGKAQNASSVSLEVGITLAEAEKQLIISTLASCAGNKTKAAEVLGIGRKTLHRKLQEYHIDEA
ncbi:MULTISPECIES: sigma-54 dependent transcriptional regulator [Sphaerochaeta]|jgi:DNA-binding NtrC family response regulator|uniref:Sigma-54 dependent transcriptional regulator n=2 Tax=Sphaerochaeta associata TaxID=1129264 RepID=A0ABY4DFG2_9SPIR|nr:MULTISPECIES: sigma-54 dependent transcriptional regulator [Sphaerochaeta]MDT3358520.1 sigma-54 dependent transcriptional regulator [Spirochaetota bacterium]MDD3423107.1 sigma-54 dependent transcriptional regulator [Sphaerochaeta sp.]MDD3455990.1 sigma-54 dependent transcriptional regulator [Sphaerochaeta sp.]MEA5107874.1 sigma-54 dependent transcriptional regulator [Sphaerochaeta associata]UOM52537.1 sigma-54 dependent transcriptional regulator [Sphaerochaeta associata]